ncbi:MAG TPA: MBL fold metallo-hydrolase [Candidatus Goldiibacteriota bacterium]|nr:MBL fold metallo-hydrolase [Candidatus Goldiibacteriota bacterium]
MKVHTLVSEDYGENTYIAETGTNKAVIIDPGADYESIKGVLATNNLSAEYVFLTHGHYDHIISAHNFEPSIIYAHISEKELIQTPAYTRTHVGRKVISRSVKKSLFKLRLITFLPTWVRVYP